MSIDDSEVISISYDQETWEIILWIMRCGLNHSASEWRAWYLRTSREVYEAICSTPIYQSVSISLPVETWDAMIRALYSGSKELNSNWQSWETKIAKNILHQLEAADCYGITPHPDNKRNQPHENKEQKPQHSSKDEHSDMNRLDEDPILKYEHELGLRLAALEESEYHMTEEGLIWPVDYL
jgi:hypothetical protein